MSGQDRCTVGITSRSGRMFFGIFCRIGIGDAVYRDLVRGMDAHVRLEPSLADGQRIRVAASTGGYSVVGLRGRRRFFNWRIGCDADPHVVESIVVPWSFQDGALLLEPPDRVLEVFRALHWPVEKEART